MDAPKVIRPGGFQAEEERIRTAYRLRDARPARGTKRDPENLGNRAYLRARDQELARLVRDLDLLPVGGRRAIEIGCGTGSVLRKLVDLGADPGCLVGVDILEERVRTARHLAPSIRFESTWPDELQFPDASFDVALTFTLFSSILSGRLAARLAQEIRRVLTPGGTILY